MNFILAIIVVSSIQTVRDTGVRSSDSTNIEAQNVTFVILCSSVFIKGAY